MACTSSTSTSLAFPAHFCMGSLATDTRMTRWCWSLRCHLELQHSRKNSPRDSGISRCSSLSLGSHHLHLPQLLQLLHLLHRLRHPHRSTVACSTAAALTFATTTVWSMARALAVPLLRHSISGPSTAVTVQQRKGCVSRVI